MVLEDKNYVPKRGIEKVTDFKKIEMKMTLLESNITEMY